MVIAAVLVTAGCLLWLGMPETRNYTGDLDHPTADCMAPAQ